LETGLGGRLDATNVVPEPALTVITSIGLDHMEYLGGTIEEIASEKAGIIKPHVPLVFDGHEEKSRNVLESTARKLDAPCRIVAENAYEILETGQKSIAFSMTDAYYGSTVWTIRTPAVYQVRNASLALEGMRILMHGEKPKSWEIWQTALKRTCWPGRMEEVADRVYLDGAHNLPGIRAFAETAARIAARPLILLFSAVEDKDHREMTADLCRELDPDLVVITRIPGSRGEETTCLKEEFEQSTRKKIIVIEELKEAFRFARGQRGDTGVLFCVGSLYLIGELKALLREEKADAEF
jgi:dihydrofolate synthase/folylpolyglutamate synthase